MLHSLHSPRVHVIYNVHILCMCTCTCTCTCYILWGARLPDFRIWFRRPCAAPIFGSSSATSVSVSTVTRSVPAAAARSRGAAHLPGQGLLLVWRCLRVLVSIHSTVEGPDRSDLNSQTPKHAGDQGKRRTRCWRSPRPTPSIGAVSIISVRSRRGSVAMSSAWSGRSRLVSRLHAKVHVSPAWRPHCSTFGGPGQQASSHGLQG